MSLLESTPDASAPDPQEVALAPRPSRFARARSHAVREMAALALPRSLLFTRGRRDHGRKRIALTFDDGPDRMTASYLDVLCRLDVRATFFVIGENAARAPELLREYVRGGHEIGGHGWSHRPFAHMSSNRLIDELARTDGLLPARSGMPKLVRPPRGALSVRALLRIAAAGYTTVLWSIDSDDCRTRDPGAVEQSVDPAKLASGDIVLLHELQPWTIQALHGIVGAMRRDGWEFVTVGELMRDA